MNKLHSPDPSSARWRARIDLGFAVRGGRSALTRRRHEGPLRVQKPFYPGDGACHLYLLHPPGGIAGQDDLEVRVDVDEGAHALVTTPAANKMYRSAGPTTSIEQQLTVSGRLEWLPQGSILFGGSQVQQTTRISLTPEARLFAWDIIALGRAASGDRFDTGRFVQRLEVDVAGSPLLIDRQAFSADSSPRQAPWGLDGNNALGILIAAPADEDLLAMARAAVPAGRVEVSLLRHPSAYQASPYPPSTQHPPTQMGALIVRALSDDAGWIQTQLTRVWGALRPAVMGCAAEPPRIWAT